MSLSATPNIQISRTLGYEVGMTTIVHDLDRPGAKSLKKLSAEKGYITRLEIGWLCASSHRGKVKSQVFLLS